LPFPAEQCKFAQREGFRPSGGLCIPGMTFASLAASDLFTIAIARGLRYQQRSLEMANRSSLWRANIEKAMPAGINTDRIRSHVSPLRAS
jgi:hypothetical protein